MQGKRYNYLWYCRYTFSGKTPVSKRDRPRYCTRNNTEVWCAYVVWGATSMLFRG